MPNDPKVPSGVPSRSSYSFEEILNNFTVLLEEENFEQELRALGTGKIRFLHRRRVIASLRALHVALWRLALLRSFPEEGEHICSLFLERLRTQAKTRHEHVLSENFEQDVLEYIDLLKQHGDTDFTDVASHLVSRFKSRSPNDAATRLKLILLIRNAYTTIFNCLI